MITFLGCDGEWQAQAGSPPVCLGQVTAMTAQDLLPQLQLTNDDYMQLRSETVAIAFAVFAVVAIRKVF